MYICWEGIILGEILVSGDYTGTHFDDYWNKYVLSIIMITENLFPLRKPWD